MKLSVKWLAGLAVLALAVVAVIGTTSRTDAATGTIYVANTASLLTNEPGQSTGDGDPFNTTSTVWSTYAPDLSNGEPLRVINSGTDADANTTTAAAGADLIKVILLDADFNISEPVTDDVTDTLDLSDPFDTSVINISDTGMPIADTAANIKIFIDGGPDDGLQIAGPGLGELRATVLSINGAGTAIQVRSEISGGSTTQDVIIEYQTSAQNTLDHGVTPGGSFGAADVSLLVKSDIDSTGRELFLKETSRSSGRFEGYVRLTDRDGGPADGGTSPYGLNQAHATSETIAGAAVLRVGSGPVTIEIKDSGGTTRTSSVLIDTSAPIPSVTAPTHGSATTNRQPVFSGSVNESGAGLDISETNLVIHEAADQTNGTAVITQTGTNTGVVQSISKAGAVDGDLSFSFTHSPGVLPTSVTTPDHIVDFQIRAMDLAGNIGFSDSDGNSAADSSVTGGVKGNNSAAVGAFDAHTVKIDQVAPSLRSSSTVPILAAGDHKTGLKLDAANAETSDGNSLRVKFNDNVSGAEPSDFSVTFPSNGSTHIPTGVQVKDENVYLTLAVAVPTNERPRVDLQGAVNDAAGNSIASGSALVADGIKPTITVTTSGGSGTGTGSESSSSLTTNTMSIEVTSSESLLAPPAVAVHVVGTGSSEATPTALSFGANTWVATYNAGSFPTGDRAVVVTAIDTAAAGTTPSNGNNSRTVSDSDTKSFRVDQELATPTLSPANGGETSQVRPFVTLDFGGGGETGTVTISEITLDGVDVTASLVPSSDKKRFFIVPSEDLAQGDHTVTVPVNMASDAAGNKNSSAITSTFSVSERDAFERPLFAGWNGVSFPSDPVDPAIDSVFMNAGHDAVLGFDPSVPGQWRIATRDAVSGDFTTTTENGLNSIRSTQAYWVHSNNFEAIVVLLVGETLPASGSPPSIVSIATVSGFNAVPIVDTTRKQTVGGPEDLLRTAPGGGTSTVTVGDYLAGVPHGRVYRWNPETLIFESLDDAAVVRTGDVLFVEVTEAHPIFP